MPATRNAVDIAPMAPTRRAGRTASPRYCAGRPLAFDGEVPEEAQRRERYADKTAAMAAGQESGTIVGDIDAAHLTLFVLSIAGWWSTVPQVTRMLCGPPTEEEHRRRDLV